MIVIATAGIVLREKFAQKVGGDDAPIEKRGRGEVVPQQFAQLAAERLARRDAEAPLIAIQEWGRQAVANRVEEDLLSGGSHYFPRMRDGGGEFGELVIEQRAAHFEGV